VCLYGLENFNYGVGVGCVTEVDWHPKEPVLVSCSNDKTLFLGEVNPEEVRLNL
jgi:WD40 repeat protein